MRSSVSLSVEWTRGKVFGREGLGRGRVLPGPSQSGGNKNIFRICELWDKKLEERKLEQLNHRERS